MQYEKMNLVTKHGKVKGPDGTLRNNWIKIGETHETRNGGISFQIHTLPVDFDGWINLALPNEDYNY